MIREVNIKVYYELDVDKDKYFNIMTLPSVVEEELYDKMCDIFANDDGFQGLRVDCDDWFNFLDEKRDRLSRYVGYHKNQMESWEP